MIINKLLLLGVPLLNVGAAFKENDLAFRRECILNEVRTLLPELRGLTHVELDHEIKVAEKQLILNVFLVESLQASFNFDENNKSLSEIKELIIEAIKRLPIKLNFIKLDDQAFRSDGLDSIKDKDTDSLKKMMHKKQKSEIKFLLEDEYLDLSFPEMATYNIDPTVRVIEFKIDYIHSRHLKIKLLHDGVRKNKNKKSLILMANKKMQNDDFYNTCTIALRSHEIVKCNAVTYISNLNNEILAMEVF